MSCDDNKDLSCNVFVLTYLRSKSKLSEIHAVGMHKRGCKQDGTKLLKNCQNGNGVTLKPRSGVDLSRQTNVTPTTSPFFSIKDLFKILHFSNISSL